VPRRLPLPKDSQNHGVNQQGPGANIGWRGRWCSSMAQNAALTLCASEWSAGGPCRGPAVIFLRALSIDSGGRGAILLLQDHNSLEWSCIVPVISAQAGSDRWRSHSSRRSTEHACRGKNPRGSGCDENGDLRTSEVPLRTICRPMLGDGLSGDTTYDDVLRRAALVGSEIARLEIRTTVGDFGRGPSANRYA